MVVLYATERNWLSLRRADFPLGWPVIGTVGWAAFLALAPEATCCLVAISGHHASADVDRVHAFEQRFPHVPLVLLSEARLPRGATGGRLVVYTPARSSELWGVMQLSCARALLSETAARVDGAGRYPPFARAAVRVACLARRPIVSVQTLAETVGCHRRSLWRHWRQAEADRGVGPLESFLDWILVLHATAAHDVGASWSATADMVGVNRHTLAQAVERVARVRLESWVADDAPALRGAFRHHVLHPLLWPGASTIGAGDAIRSTLLPHDERRP